MRRNLLLPLLLLLSLATHAQLTVTGTITDKADQIPIIGASIIEIGTDNGTTSDFDGKFELKVNENAQLQIRYVGYASQIIDVAGRSTIDILLAEDATTLEGVLVTAYGIEKEKKAAGFSFGEVGGEELTEAREVNVAAQLAGKVAGLDIVKPSNGPSGSTRITIRGLSQFSGENRPLLVIDGIPADNSNVNTAGLYGGRDSGDGFSSINPDDIESITVLKGPSAAALYGARAGNGVLLITTKKGKGRKGIGIEYSSNYVTEEVTILPVFQNEYGQGANGEKPTSQQEALDNWRSWGAKLDGSMTPIFNGDSLPYSTVGQEDIRDYYQRGSTFTNSLSMTAGSEKMNARLSLSKLSNQGIIPNTTYDRYTINLSTSAKLTDKVSIDGKVNYVLEEAENRTNLTDNPSNPSKYFTISPANLPHEVFRQTRDELGNPIYWSSNPFTLSPYWGPIENINNDTKNRVLGYVSARWQLLPWLSAQGRMATDQSDLSFFNIDADGTQYLPLGAIYIDDFKIIERNYDFILNANHDFSKRLGLTVNAGATRTDLYNKVTNISGTDFINPGFLSINNMADRNPGRINTTRSRVNGLFATASLAINSNLYLEGSLRNDFFSVLTNPLNLEKSENSILYGSGSVSYILSDALKLPDWWSFAKVRAGYGSSGFAQINPYSQVAVYSVSPDPKETETGVVSLGSISGDEFRNPSLQPSRTLSFEVGTDLNFVNNRFGLEFTYYNQRTDKHIFLSPLPTSSGFGTLNINAGEVQNSGIEILARAAIIKNKDFNWDVSLNFSKNKNIVLSLNEGVDQLNIGVDRTFSANIVAQEGGQVGDIWGNVYARNDAGQIIHDDNGLPMIAAEREILGNFNPDWYGGLNSSLAYKNVSLSILIDTKQGGEILSTTSSFGYLFGRHVNTLEGRDNPDFMLIGEGVSADGSTPNATPARIDTYYERVSSISEVNVYDASYIKLRQVSLSYSVPVKSLKKLKFVQSLNVSLVGRNLFFFTNGLEEIGLDPESIYTATASDVGIEYAAMPSTRTFGVNLSVKF